MTRKWQYSSKWQKMISMKKTVISERAIEEMAMEKMVKDQIWCDIGRI